ncbi:hypothetical protein [Salinibaculum rarum]|jgi:hypothetical protein|uniref:hypothetical protein n=1 Tax=Salinibaculum rarum TaxID=3058903 RepID=UPI00265F74A4|nr:hypothetical protein [Salinibaculum sp. KK48]
MSDNSDPFQPFRQLFDQFESTGSNSMPGLGWPLSPVPIPTGDTAPMSPEESTKRAVKQLYSALAALSETESMTATGGAWKQYLDAFDLEATSFGPEQLTAATLRTYRVWFFSLTQVLVESYTLRLVQDELVVEDHRQRTGTQKWLWALPQSDREQLLKRCTDVPDDLVAEMKALRQRRDELFYTFGGWDEVTVDDSLDDLRRSLAVLTALDDRVSEGTPFSYLPDGSSGEASIDTGDDTEEGGKDSTERQSEEE